MAGDGRLSSLKARMALILGIVLAPPLLYSIWQAVEAYESRQRQQAQAIESLLRVVSAYEAEFIDRTISKLEGLADQPELRDVGGGGCERLLVQVKQRSRGYGHFLVTTADGHGICSTTPQLLRDFSHRRWFARLKAGEPFVVSDTIEGWGDGLKTVVVAIRLPEPSATEFAGALAVAVDLQVFNETIRDAELPREGVAFLVDSEGHLVIDPMRLGMTYATAAPRRVVLERVVREAEGLEAEGRDGIRRTYVARNIAGGALHVVLGVPVPSPWAWLEHELVIGIFAPTVMVALAVVAIWIASDFLVNRHVRALAAAARAYSRGNLETRLSLEGAPLELQELARVLSRMAERIQRRESELRASLSHKDVMLKEIHHRVKNNLQIVTSLLNLRARKIPSPVARDALNEAQLRIRALALVHRYLYETEEVQYVELSNFLRELCELLVDANDASAGRVAFELAAEPTCAATDQAIPIALLTTEAVSNAYAYAFPDGRTGRISLRLANDGARAKLMIADNGVGMNVDEQGSGSREGFGLTLIRMFVKQIGGELSLATEQGTRIEVTFPLPADVRERGEAPMPEEVAPVGAN